MARYGVFTESDAKKVADATRRVLAVPATRRVLGMLQQSAGSIPGLEPRDAITTTAITPASDAKTGATTFSFTFLVPDPDNDGDLMDGTSGTGTNRSLDTNAGSGTYIVVARIAGEWRPIWVDC